MVNRISILLLQHTQELPKLGTIQSSAFDEVYGENNNFHHRIELKGMCTQALLVYDTVTNKQLPWIQTETTHFFFDQCSQSFLGANHSWDSVCRQAAQLVKFVKFAHDQNNLLKQIHSPLVVPRMACNKSNFSLISKSAVIPCTKMASWAVFVMSVVSSKT